MEKREIPFSGMSWNPSEHEAPDGALCAMVNLLSEDGELRPWMQADDSYEAIIPYDHLLYDIEVSQDTPVFCTVTTRLTSTLKSHLKAVGEPLPTRRTLIDRIFPHFYDSRESYATGATMIAAHMEAAIDREASRRGNGVFKHICFGIVTLQLTDGSSVLYSPIFALIPATMPGAITADYAAEELSCSVSLHRHRITVTMRHPTAEVHRLVESAQVYLSRPVSFLDMRRALQSTVNAEGLATSLTFGILGPQDTAEVFEHLDFYPSTTIGREQFGHAVALQNISTLSAPLTPGHLRRLPPTVNHTITSHGHRYLLHSPQTLPHPFAIGLTYIYPTATAQARRDATGVAQEELLRSEKLADFRPDIYDHAEGIRAQLAIRLSVGSDQEAWFFAEVPYPLPGVLMYPYVNASYAELHLRVMAPDGDHYHTATVYLRQMGDHGFRAAVFATEGGAHRASRPAFHSLLLHQVRTVYLDNASGLYEGGSMLWQTERTEDFELAKSKAIAAPLPEVMLTGFHAAAADGISALTTQQGVMLTALGKTTCVSVPLHGRPFDLSRLPHIDDIIATQTGISRGTCRYAPFRSRFLPSARLSIDTCREHLVLSTSEHPYALVYSLRSQQWGAIAADTMTVTPAGLPFLLCTRALSFDLRHVPKTVDSVILRGCFDDTFHHSHIGMALYGSNDLAHWHLVATSRNRWLTHLRGTPFRWHRVVVTGTLLGHERISGMGVSFYKKT